MPRGAIPARSTCTTTLFTATTGTGVTTPAGAGRTTADGPSAPASTSAASTPTPTTPTPTTRSSTGIPTGLSGMATGPTGTDSAATTRTFRITRAATLARARRSWVGPGATPFSRAEASAPGPRWRGTRHAGPGWG